MIDAETRRWEKEIGLDTQTTSHSQRWMVIVNFL
jgi:hypothetical protein